MPLLQPPLLPPPLLPPLLHHHTAQTVKAQVVLFAAMLVLLTLVVQAPLLGPVIRALKLTVAGPERLDVRRRAVAKLSKATQRAMQQLRDDEDEMLQGAGVHGHSAVLGCSVGRL